jgi:hypothetical protein
MDDLTNKLLNLNFIPEKYFIILKDNLNYDFIEIALELEKFKKYGLEYLLRLYNFDISLFNLIIVKSKIYYNIPKDDEKDVYNLFNIQVEDKIYKNFLEYDCEEYNKYYTEFIIQLYINNYYNIYSFRNYFLNSNFYKSFDNDHNNFNNYKNLISMLHLNYENKKIKGIENKMKKTFFLPLILYKEYLDKKITDIDLFEINEYYEMLDFDYLKVLTNYLISPLSVYFDVGDQIKSYVIFKSEVDIGNENNIEINFLKNVYIIPIYNVNTFNCEIIEIFNF